MMRRVIFTLALLLCISLNAYATINYGDFPGDKVTYFNVSEDDQGLFEEPHVVGDSLVFNPTGFGVQASGAGGIGFLDGTMNTLVVANGIYDIDSIEIEEYGDYSLIGTGGLGTLAKVTCAAFFRIEEVEGIALTIPVTVTQNMIYTPSDGDYNLQDDGPGSSVIWEGELNFDADAALLAAGISGKATKIYMTVDNQLVATSENGTLSFIKKKQVDGFTITRIPEPATICLLSLGALALRRRKRA